MDFKDGAVTLASGVEGFSDDAGGGGGGSDDDTVTLVGVRKGEEIDMGESRNIEAVILFRGVLVAFRPLKIPEALIPGAGEPSI